MGQRAKRGNMEVEHGLNQPTFNKKVYMAML